MAYYLASDGTNDYVQLQAPVTINAGQNYRIEIDIECSDNDAFGVRLFGVSGSDANRFSIFDGVSANAVFVLFGSKNVGLPVDVLDRHTWALFRNDGVTNGLRVDGVLSPASGANSAGLSFDWLLAQRTATRSRNAVNLYRMKVWIDGVLAHDWNPSNRSLGDSVLVDEVGGNHGTLMNFATDGSQWVYYDDGGAPVDYPVELLATAAITLPAEKIGQAVAGLNAAAAAAVAAHKIAQAQLAVNASQSASLTANKIGQSLLPVSASSIATATAGKIGFGAASLNANADINLISGNVIVVEASINFNAAASIGLSGQKRAAGSVAFSSAANIQISDRKTGTANVNLTAASAASFSATKLGAAAASLQFAATFALFNSKASYSSFTVPVTISITLSGLSAATKPVAQVVYINTRSKQRSLLTTSSEQQLHITTHSRQRYSLQSGGVSV